MNLKIFKDYIEVDNVSLANIQKLYRVENANRNKNAKNWSSNPLGVEPTSEGVTRAEID